MSVNGRALHLRNRYQMVNHVGLPLHESCQMPGLVARDIAEGIFNGHIKDEPGAHFDHSRP